MPTITPVMRVQKKMIALPSAPSIAAPPAPPEWISALVNGQGAVVQLQDGQVTGRRVHLADGRAGPAAVLVLLVGQELEELLAVLAPGQPLLRPGLGEHLGVAVLAQAVDHLGVVVVRVL